MAKFDEACPRPFGLAHFGVWGSLKKWENVSLIINNSAARLPTVFKFVKKAESIIHREHWSAPSGRERYGLAQKNRFVPTWAPRCFGSAKRSLATRCRRDAQYQETIIPLQKYRDTGIPRYFVTSSVVEKRNNSKNDKKIGKI